MIGEFKNYQDMHQAAVALLPDLEAALKEFEDGVPDASFQFSVGMLETARDLANKPAACYALMKILNAGFKFYASEYEAQRLFEATQHVNDVYSGKGK